MSQIERYCGDGTANESAELPSTVVIEAVAAAADVDPHELDPLYGVVDPDALDDLFADAGAVGSHRVGRVEFTYCGFEVAVSWDGSSTNVTVY